MKKIFTLIAFLSLTLAGFAQGQNSSSYEELMRKARKARTTSIIMVSTGPVIAAGGIGTLIYGLIMNAEDRRDYYIDINGNYVEGPEKKYTTEIVAGAVGTVVGIGVALGSIAFSDKAYKLRREARKVKATTSMDRILIPGYQGGFGNNGANQYKLTLSISL